MQVETKFGFRSEAKREKVRPYYQIGPDFSGMGPGALWADTKVRMARFLLVRGWRACYHRCLLLRYRIPPL
jgi:hypothetical protein